MDTLHAVLRSMNGEMKSRRDHLDVFREFIGHLDRAARRRPPTRATMKSAKAKAKRGRK